MPELKSMTAIIMLEDLINCVERTRGDAISKIPMLTIDSETFVGVSLLINNYSEITDRILNVARILKKEG
jgi:hypothetical protein